MTIQAFLGDVVHLNFSHAGKRIKDFFVDSTWPGLKNLVQAASGDEKEILEKSITLGVQEVLAKGISTDTFLTVGKDVLASLIEQNITKFNMQHVMALLNAEVAPLAPPVVLPVSTDPVPAV